VLRRPGRSTALAIARAGRRAARRLRGRRDERGYSAIELVLYAPILMILSLLAVQFAVIYLGNQVASGAAREGNRVARVTEDRGAGTAKAAELTDALGGGVLEDVRIDVVRVGDEMETTVSGHAMKVIPFIDPPRVSETVRGPVEMFVAE